jgi:hypothetical protein
MPTPVAITVPIAVPAPIAIPVTVAMSVAIAVPAVVAVLRHGGGADAHRCDDKAGGGKHGCDFHDNSSQARTSDDEEEYAPVRAWLLNMVVGLGTGFR